MREILNMRMALTANQQHHAAELLSSFKISSALPLPEGTLRVPPGAPPTSPVFTADTSAFASGVSTVQDKQKLQLPAAANRSGVNDATSPGPSIPSSLISSPDTLNPNSIEKQQRRKSFADQELDELSCAAHQLTLSMELTLPPSQGEEAEA